MENWHVLYTKPHSEGQVAGALTASGIVTYFPVMPVVSPRRGRSPVRPYFPCYLFAHLDLEKVGISRLNWMPGMRHLVAFGGMPAHVSDAVIACIHEHLAQPHAMDADGEILEHGDRVVVTAGPFKGIEAVFDKRLSAAGRVQILVQLLQRWTVCDIEVTALHRISPFDACAL